MRILTISTGRVEPLYEHRDGPLSRVVVSAIRKLPVSTLQVPDPVRAGPLGLAGDEQADPTVHGGFDKAIYAYPVEHYGYWSDARARQGLHDDLPHGMLGENLTVEGLDEQALWVGDRLAIGEVVLRVTEPRQPCHKFVARMGYPQAARDMLASGRTGFYLSVEQPGALAAGMPITLVPGDRSLSVATMTERRRRRPR